MRQCVQTTALYCENTKLHRFIRHAVVWSFVFIFTLVLHLGDITVARANIDEQKYEQVLVEGVTLHQWRRFDSQGWLNIYAVEIDQTAQHITVDTLLGHDVVTKPETVRDMAKRTGALVAMNGDFFHINTSGAPLGPQMRNGQLIKTGPSQRQLAVGIGASHVVEPIITLFDAHLAIQINNDVHIEVDAFNEPIINDGDIVMYNEYWASSAAGPDWPDTLNAQDLVHVLVDGSERVVDVLFAASEGPEIPPGGFVLVGRGAGGDTLRNVAQKHDDITFHTKMVPNEQYNAVIAGQPKLLEQGRPVAGLAADVHPRSAIGYSEDGLTIWFVVVDGRSAQSRGVTLPELADIMAEVGAYEALNVDGGGSTTLVTQDEHWLDIVVRNAPSDGVERKIPNGVGVFVEHIAYEPEKIQIILPDPLTSYELAAEEIRIAPKAHYELNYVVTDELGMPLEVDAAHVQWRVEPPDLARVVEPGVVQALRPGKGRVIAALPGQDEAEAPLRVIGEPVALEVEPLEISVEPEGKVVLQAYALDAYGFRAPLLERDVAWEPYGDIGSLTGSVFRAANTSASGAVVASFGDIQGRALVGIGGEPTAIADFEEQNMWRSTVYPAEVKASLQFTSDPALVRQERQIAQLDYDFTTTTKTRAAYVQPSTEPLDLPGRPLKIGAWVFGDGNGAWLRAQISDRFGVVTPIDFAEEVDWTGWRYVEAVIPDGIEYPVALRSIYVVETSPTESYTGRMYFDEIVAVYAPDFDTDMLPPETQVVDANNVPFVEEKLSTAPDFQFVVFGDSKVEAGKDHALGAQLLSRMIDEINEHDIPFALFTGDLIENDTESNYKLGKSYLDRLTMPYYVAPANHEIAGTNSFANFRRFFGETYGVFEYENALFIKLNTARPGIRNSEPEQWAWLLETVQNVSVDHVFIYMHIPTVDPLPGGTTGWSDGVEVGLFEKRLAELAEHVENVYVFSGHVHGFARRAHDGVQYITTAGAGSPLYMPPIHGGFYHYVLLTVTGSDVFYEVVPLIERIDVSQHTVHVTKGESVVLEAEGVAPFDAVRFPLRYPAQVRWSLTDESIGTIHPATGKFTALRAGETTAQIRSAKQIATVHIIVEDAPDTNEN